MKKYNIFYFTTFLFFIIQATIGWTQTPDCRQIFNTGRLVCGNASFATDNLTRVGNVDDFNATLFPNNNPGCLIRPFTDPGGGPNTTEAYSAWYAFRIQTSGTLTFVITPNNITNDFDFGIWGPNVTCTTLGTPNRCNFAPAGAGLTGLTTANPVPNAQFSPAMNVVAGELYYMMINNFSNNNSGFSLTWGGTAQLAVVSALFGTPSVSCNKASFISTSATCDNTATLSYMWNFGDGSPVTATNSLASPTYIYSAPGTYNVTLTVTVNSSNVNNGVTSTYSAPVTITSVPPAPTFSSLADQYCITAPAFNLSATPTGGTFTIRPNITGTPITNATQFNPATLGPGTHTVTYQYISTTNASCTGQVVKNVKVNALPTPAITGLASNYCPSSPNVTLTGTPTGGTFTINGTSATIFSPATLGAGNYAVVYSYTDPLTTCSNTTTQNVVISSPPTLAITGLNNTYCETNPIIPLVGTPTGGTFTINGTTATQFNPATLGVGTYTVVYDLGNGCSAPATQVVQVTPKPVLSFTGLNTQYCKNIPAFALQANPSGGIFKIDGNVVTQLDPNTLANGLRVVSYEYTSPTDVNCKNTITQNVTINALPTLVFTGLNPAYCVSATAFNLVATPTGGTFQINNVNATQFDPTALGVGSHIVKYTFTDANTCTNTITQNVVVNPLPTIVFTNVKDVFCISSPSFTMQATPAGGTFQINNVNATQFNPLALGLGNHIVKYTVTDANGCTNSTTKNVQIQTKPVLTLIGLNAQYCVNNAGFALSATPTGGTFQINGTNATQFNPTALGVGNHVVKYTYIDPTDAGCFNDITQNVSVLALPTLTFTGLNVGYCVDASVFNLSATPAGGTFQINNINATQFDPTTLGVGNHIVKYTFTDANSCVNSITQNVAVNPLPTLTFVNVKESYCISSPAFNMQATPSGGIFRINNVIATQFNPLSLGLGAYNVTYNFTDANGCSNQITKNGQIQVKPVLNFVGLNTQYCVNNTSFALSATPTGGTFQINGTNATQFNPATLGAGNHIVKYNYIDPTDVGCFNEITQNVVIVPLTTLNFVGLNTAYCVDASAFNLVANPLGGTFTINNITTTAFNPTALGAGNHIVKYTFIDANTCVNNITQNVVVNPLPTLNFVNLKDTYCTSSPTFNLQANPAGGIFTINGIVSTQFNPATLGVGNVAVEYDFTDANGCENFITKNVIIGVKPTLAFVGLNTQYCADVTAFNLQASPTGGTFTINGTNATQFNPATLGAGNYVIKYNYIDPTDAGCFNEITENVVINGLPVVVFGNVNDKYCVNETTTITPNVQITFGNGATLSQNLTSFSPNVVGVGTQTLSFTAIDPVTNCQKTFTKNVLINALPTLSFVGLPLRYCVEANPFALNATPSGGSFSLNNTTLVGNFDPKTFRVGDIVIVKYTFTDGNGCSNSITQNLEIIAPDNFTSTKETLKICPPELGYELMAMTLAEEIALKNSGKRISYKWNNGATTRNFFIRDKGQEGTQSVEVVEDSGCPVLRRTFEVAVNCEPKLILPTAFTPNGDGLNDNFEIKGGDFAFLNFQIYNRWGEIVFVSRGKDDNWDGTFMGKPCPEGVYVWQAKYENILKKDEKTEAKGQVTLVR
jgi:gliding motility-associated-like protein